MLFGDPWLRSNPRRGLRVVIVVLFGDPVLRSNPRRGLHVVIVMLLLCCCYVVWRSVAAIESRKGIECCNCCVVWRSGAPIESTKRVTCCNCYMWFGDPWLRSNARKWSTLRNRPCSVFGRSKSQKASCLPLSFESRHCSRRI